MESDRWRLHGDDVIEKEGNAGVFGTVCGLLVHVTWNDLS